MLVKIMNDNPFTNTLIISEGVEHSHETVIRLLRNSQDLPQLSLLKSETIKTKGRPAEVYWLSEEQATLLITLMRNSKKVRLFKSALVKEFYEMKNFLNSVLVQKQNKEYLENRLKGKVARKECTDVIKKFVEYAESQGSQSADKYYIAISNMELSGLFIMEQRYPNAREVMDMRQLNRMNMADEAVAIALEEGMKQGLHYKDCYKLAKEKIEMLAKVLPRSPLPALLNKDIKELSDE